MKTPVYEGRLGTRLPFHPKLAPHFHEELHLYFPESLPPIQKPVLSRSGKFVLLPVLQPLLSHTMKSSASQFSPTSLQMVTSEHFWAKFHLQDTAGFEREEDRQISKYKLKALAEKTPLVSQKFSTSQHLTFLFLKCTSTMVLGPLKSTSSNSTTDLDFTM